MSTGKVGVVYRFWLGAALGSGLLASGIATGDFTVTVRNPGNTATMASPTVTEVGATGLYFFDVLAAFSTTGGVGSYGVHVEVNSTSPNSRGVIVESIDFFANNIDDGVQVSGMDAATITAAAIATDAIDADALATDAVNEIRDAILSDSTPFDGADIAAILLDTGTTLPAQITALNNLGLTDLISFTPTLGSIEESLLHAMYDTPIGLAVTIDPQAANTSTTIGNGTITNPVSTEAAARTIADAMGTRSYWITRFGTVTLTQTTFDFVIAADYGAARIDLNGQDSAGTRCVNLNIIGTNASSFAFSNSWEDCSFKDAFGLDGIFTNCIFDPGVGFTSGATLLGCSSFDDTVLDIGMNGTSTFFLRVFDFSGRLAISDMNAAASKVDIECHGGAQVRIDADVLQLGAGIRIGGTFALTNLSALTPDLSGRVGEVADDYLGQVTVHGSGLWDAVAAGLTQQQVRDAMKLAPTGGAPAVGSIDAELDAIIEAMRVVDGTVSAGASSTSVPSTITGASDDRFNNMQVLVGDGTNLVARNVNDYTSATGTFVVDDLGFTPGAGATIIVVGRTGSVPIDTSAIATAIKDLDVTGNELLPDSLGRILDLLNKVARGRARTNVTLQQFELYDPVDDALLLTYPLTDFGGGAIVNVVGSPFNRGKATEV